ncbi:MAG: uracil-DNA glycosylase [Proteobacteria bacterium]|jgi:DNA polymerase|nr:uracil-DNA glycosylase [Alphaproteobacteria bacterium]NCC03536.1 uracil-DNA glycosylase [Pseudomonadota bacterium]
MQMNIETSPYFQLIWQEAFGADEAIASQAGMIHWLENGSTVSARPQPLREGLKAAEQGMAERRQRERGPVSLSPMPVVTIEAASLEELRVQLEGYEGCSSLKQTAMNLVFGQGSAFDPAQTGSRIMIIGDVPSEDDDRSGLPFSGRAGILLDKMLESIGLAREGTYLANMVYWRPPGNRTPTHEEVAACLPFVSRQIALVRPSHLLCFGGLAVKYLLKSPVGVAKARGKWGTYLPPLAQEGAEGVPCLPTYHPHFLLDQPRLKRLVWQDLLSFMKETRRAI